MAVSKDTSKPQPTKPGEAPADTTDPSVVVASVSPDKRSAAAAGHGSVNAVVPVDPPETVEEPSGEARTETYDAVRPDGKKVNVTHNLETGETSVK